VRFDGNAPGLLFSKRALPDGAWSEVVNVAQTQLIYGQHIEARGDTVVIQYQENLANKIIVSRNRGQTFSAPVDMNLAGQVLGLTLRSADEFAVVSVRVSGSWYLEATRTLDGGATWSTPVVIDTFPSSTAYPGLTARLGANAQGYVVGYSYSVVDGRAFGEGTHHAAFSSDFANWDVDELTGYTITRGNGSDIAVLVSETRALIATGKGPGSYMSEAPAKVWRRSGDGWTGTEVADMTSSDRIFLAQAPGGEVVLIRSGASGFGAAYCVSRDGGQTFGGARSLPSPGALDYVYNLISAFSSSQGVHLLWFGAMEASPATSVMAWHTGTIESVGDLQWIGNTYHWPWDGDLSPDDPLWINTDTWPAGAAVNAYVVYTVDGGATWHSAALEKAGSADDRDWWHVNLSWLVTAGATIEYAVVADDGRDVAVWDSNGGANFKAEVSGGFDGPVQWVGNTYHWPLNGAFNPGEDLWINVDTWPLNTAVRVTILYSVNGGPWEAGYLNLGDPSGNNDHWYGNLGSFQAGDWIQYAILAEDTVGTYLWDNNRGSDFFALCE